MKKFYFILLGAVIFMGGCSTYKSSQTPDDVYYSPGSHAVATTSNNGEYYTTPNDQYVRMRVQDPERWSYFDDYNYDYYAGYSAMGYGYSPYGYGSFFSPWIGFGYYSPLSYWNSYYSWNNFYNPYYGSVVVVNTKASSAYGYTQLRTFSPASYTNQTLVRGASSVNPYSYSQTIRRNYNIVSNANYYRPSYGHPESNGFSQPARSYTPSSFNTSGSFRSAGGGAGMSSRPSRR
jgi:hypothetical protein